MRFLAGVLLLAAVVGCRSNDKQAAPDLTVDWGSGDGRPGCVYDEKRETVDAELTITGRAAGPTAVTVKVTAHADENTSEPVGSGTRTVRVEGAVDETLVVSFPVAKAPHVDIDGVTACSRTVKY